MVKISNFIIGMIIASLVITSMVWLMADLSVNYGSTYDDDDFSTYNQLEKLNQDALSIKNQTEAGQEQDGALDVIGSYFRQGYQALMVTKNSYSVFENMTDQAINKDAGFGERGRHIKMALAAIILILLFVGVFISAIVKKDV